MRQGHTRRLKNRIVRTRARSAVKAAKDASPASDKAQGEAAVLLAIRELDKAATKGVIHPNNAARRKSRLLRGLKKTPGR
jgi:small subunit ribosomal protein S20